MKINIFECLQSEQMRQFVTGYAEAIRPVSDGNSLSIAAAEASINGTMDFMEQVGELTDVVTDTDLGGNAVVTFADELEELFGGDDAVASESEKVSTAGPAPSEALPPYDASLLPDVPTKKIPTDSGKGPPPSAPESMLESHLSMINL